MEGTSIKNIIDSMNYYQDKVNEHSGKPYYVEFSYGFRSLICSENLDIEGEMIYADEALYEDKKNKRKDVRKNHM
jgi:hypothetical protein